MITQCASFLDTEESSDNVIPELPIIVTPAQAGVHMITSESRN